MDNAREARRFSDCWEFHITDQSRGNELKPEVECSS